MVTVDYGHSMHVWDFKKRELQYSLNLGDSGIMPLEIRFLHDPTKAIGFVGCAYSSTIYRFERNEVMVLIVESCIPHN